MAKKSTGPKIDRKIKTLLKKYEQSLRREGISVDKLLLFGSHARGNPKPWSDIDVAVISNDFGHDYFDEGVRLMILARKTSNLIEPHPLHPDDLNDRWNSLASEIRLYGTPIDK